MEILIVFIILKLVLCDKCTIASYTICYDIQKSIFYKDFSEIYLTFFLFDIKIICVGSFEGLFCPKIKTA